MDKTPASSSNPGWSKRPKLRDSTTAAISRLLRPAEVLLEALSNPARRERAIVWTLVGYCAVWSLYGALAKSSQDVHFDMGEMVAWSREVFIGTPKHPPFAAWLVRGWFALFPLADWAYYLFAMVLASFALWVAWRVLGRFLDGEKRVVGLVFLTLIPFFNFHALKFNANAVLVPLWAVTTWWYLRSYQSRHTGWAALAGVAAAASMLGKYWSIVLLAGLGAAALADQRRSDYFRSPAPWVTAFIGTLVLAPHVAYLFATDFTPLTYAATSHQSDFAGAARSGLGFVLGVIGYMAAPIAVFALATRPNLAALADTIWPQDPDRRFALIAFVVPILLPPIAAVALKVDIVSLWMAGAMTLLPVVLLSSPRVILSHRAATILLALALAFPVLMTLAAPIIAIAIHRQGLSNNATHYRLVARAVENAWHQVTDKPLRVVGSQTNLVNGMAFYLGERPSTLDIVAPQFTPWADETRVTREGVAMVCPEPDELCMTVLKERERSSQRAKHFEVVISHTYFNAADAPVRYVIVIVLPQP